MTIQDQVARYLASCESQGLSPKSILSYRGALEGVFLPWAQDEGIQELGELDQEAVERYQLHVYARTNHRFGEDRGKPISRHTVHRYIRTLRQVVNWAKLEDLKPKPPKLGKVARDVLSRAEQQRLEDACRSERDRLMIILMGRRALRNTEVVLLTGDDLMALGRKYFLRVNGKGAGGQHEQRMVPLKPDLYRMLRHFVETKPADAPETIFYSDNRSKDHGPFRPLTDSGVRQAVKVVAMEARIRKPLYPHLLRHSVITYWRLERGIPDIQIKQIAGNFTALDGYTHHQEGQSYAFHEQLD